MINSSPEKPVQEGTYLLHPYLLAVTMPTEYENTKNHTVLFGLPSIQVSRTIHSLLQ